MAAAKDGVRTAVVEPGRTSADCRVKRWRLGRLLRRLRVGTV